VNLARQVCRGLSVAHRENPPIIHRDIKPQNILVGYEADGLRARVSDFGLAKQVNPLTLLATAAGTLAYKPPEAFADKKGDSCAGDVWAIGTTLYLLLTDQLPFKMPNDLGWGSRNLFTENFVPPSEINPDANAGMDQIIATALTLDPKGRYPSATSALCVRDSPCSVIQPVPMPSSYAGASINSNPNSMPILHRKSPPENLTQSDRLRRFKDSRRWRTGS
jgi:serine/threonine-protein kinase